MSLDTIRQRLRRKLDATEYRHIRRLWIAHSIAEDQRDIPGLIATLAEDCVYELVQSGHRWVGHEGAKNFYTDFLGAYPDIHFDLQEIVIGPQGVFEEAIVTGTHIGKWLGIEPTGNAAQFMVNIYFPWNRDAQLFAGEKVYIFNYRDNGTLIDLTTMLER